MESLSLTQLILLLVGLILVSGFFSSAETGMMSVNRYRIRHLVRRGHRGASRVEFLLKRTDRLLGTVLIGNTFANVMSSAVTTLIAFHLHNESAVLVLTVLLTIVLLIFAEMIPKTIAASYSQTVAIVLSWPLQVVLYCLYPIIWTSNLISNSILRLLRLKTKTEQWDTLSSDELRSVVSEAGKHVDQDMLLGVLDLVQVSVEHIMIPRHEIMGINLDEDWSDILTQLTNSQYTRLPLYRGDIENVEGIVHMRSALNLLAENKLDKQSLLRVAQSPYFVPESTPLSTQLINFKRERCRTALVVDEYGDIVGLITLEDILEEIIGEFTTGHIESNPMIYEESEGSYLLDAGLTLRELRRIQGWQFPETQAKTLNGLIVDTFQAIPNAATCLRVAGYPVEIVKVIDNTVRTVRIFPALKR